MHMNPTLMVDAYKLGHYAMQPPGVTFVWDGWTARSNKYMPDTPETVHFGYQYTIKRYFKDFFDRWFFSADIDELEKDFIRKVSNGFNPQYADFTRFRKLHKLGYLPICIMSLPEGTLVPVRVPVCVIYNTHEDFAWLPQYLEDMWSCHNWQPSTSATTAYDRRKILQHYVDLTCERFNYRFIEPDVGMLACGIEDIGKLASRDVIISKIDGVLQKEKLKEISR